MPCESQRRSGLQTRGPNLVMMGSNPTVTATRKAPTPLETLGCGAFVLSGATVAVTQQ